MEMTAEQRHGWKVALELKLRKSNGDSFQDFFCTVMFKVHSDDFVRVRPYGQLGDKGCDGYLQSNGQVFQCYGAVDGGGEGKVAYLIGKMETDYGTAAKKVADIMKEWYMVHNFVEGLPIDAVQKLEELRSKNKKRKFGFVSLEGFEDRIFKLDAAAIEGLLGPVATNAHAHNFQPQELKQIIAAIASAADELPVTSNPIGTVPVDKLVFNKLPGHWHWLISAGWQNAHHVSGYLNRHHDPLVGEKVAQIFRDKYKYLRAQNLAPGAIMSALYEFVTGVGSVSPSRQVAAQALLAYLFESCDIFEDAPKINA
jgi:hypothetical protein